MYTIQCVLGFIGFAALIVAICFGVESIRDD